MLIFYEKQHAERILREGIHDSKLSFHDLSLVASYLRYEVGKTRKQALNDLIDLCKDNNPDFNYVLSRNFLNSVLNKSDLYDLRKPRSIEVTKSEMDIIRKNFEDYRHQKVLFWMLVVAKFFQNKDHYRKRRKKDNDDRYFYNFGLARAFRMAKVYVDKKTRYDMLYDFQQSGLINTTYHGSFEILFVDNDDQTEIVIDDLDDIISFFPYYCANCDKKYEWSPYSKNQLCDDCYEKERKEYVREKQRAS